MPALHRPGDPRTLLLTGDVHGNGSWWRDAVFPALRRTGADVVVQVGDFGLWPGPRGQAYLDWLQSVIASGDGGDALPEDAQADILWLDGNHEDSDQLEATPPRQDGLRAVRPNIVHLPRGHRWTWRGVRFMAVGGAVSMDRAFRREGASWWPQEQLGDGDVERIGGLARREPVDVLLTHDAPYGLPFDLRGDHDPVAQRRRRRLGAVVDDVIRHRARLQVIVEAAAPRLHVHGHYHVHRLLTVGPEVRASFPRPLAWPDGCTVLSLDRDGRPGNLALLDLDRWPDVDAALRVLGDG